MRTLGAGSIALSCALAFGCAIYGEELLLDDDGHDGASGGTGGQGLGGASGGSSSGGSGSGGDATGGQGGEPLVRRELLDDFEDGNVLVKASHGRTGNWDIANDGVGVQTPSPFAIQAGTGAPSSEYGAYTTGSGFTTWASLNVSMRGNGQPYDASAYRGLSFRAKVGAGSASTIRVRVVSGDTDPRGGVCRDPSADPAPPPEEYCYDHFFQEVELDEEWATYEVSFADFGQSDTGMHFDAIELSKIYQLEFYFDRPSSIELWLDDVYFVLD